MNFMRNNKKLEALPILLDFVVYLENQLEMVTAALAKTQDTLKRCEMMNRDE